ncbi:ABC transporter substrate-binding protein [Blastococcus saxobsidens]|uniref:Putative Amino acid-binding protein n=1 Tax=Blastococcus saxobsidens (strain DD2) TaxID=1146883 RepID=H6RX47_BLASD|nr:ABC transporter substrate-binding protein [Blastococcus saxobsidens]CCG03455.1 putative Amino acid-binding protein [Blastococcus saxobsidens DD2]
MTKNRTAAHAKGVVATVGVAALLVSGCTREEAPVGAGEEGAASPGITDDSVSIGTSSPLSGPTAGPGSCSVAGLAAYIEAKNAAGGFEFGDGNTRTVEFTYLDDAYDPARAVSNFRQLVDDGMFAYVGALGTPTNAAVMPIAEQQEVPQVLLMTGATMFSEDPEAHPWTTGFVPTYAAEGRAFGELLADADQPVTVATLAQNDDFGESYLRGFEEAIEGSQVEVVASATYEPTDTTLDSQVTELAASNADVLLSAVSVTPLQVGVLRKAQSLGWTPRIFLPSNTSTPAVILQPGGAAAYPAVYTPTFAKNPNSPAFAEDEDVQAYNEAFEQYGADIAPAYTPHCAWSYAEGAVLEEAFANMEEPTRESFMTALNSISGFEAPLLLDGVTVDTTQEGEGAVSTVELVQYDGESGFTPVDGY